MTSIAEAFKAELLARLQASPSYGPSVDRIRRSHLTEVTREESPAVYLRFPEAKPTEDKACNWQWSLNVVVTVFSRDDSGDAMADPLVVEVVKRINPTLDSGYGNKVTLQLTRITSDNEVADEDATKVEINLIAEFTTPAWSLEART